MKTLVLSLVLVTSIHVFGQEDYTIQLNDKTFDIAADKQYEFNVDGKKITFILKSKDTLTYNDGFYSFNYPGTQKISKTEVEEGIEQIMLMTAGGSGILIQKYDNFNPAMLNEMMLNEITKESVSYGFKLTREDYSRTLKTGEKVNVLKAVLKYKDETSTYEVASYGKKDEGIMVMTMMTEILGEAAEPRGEKMIKLMWDSLMIN